VTHIAEGFWFQSETDTLPRRGGDGGGGGDGGE